MVVYVDQAHGQDKWLRLFVEQAGGKAEVKKVQIRPANGNANWIDLTNKWGSAWEISQAPPFPLDVNIVGTEGDTVTAYGVLTNKGVGKMPTNVQFKMSNPADTGLVNTIGGGGGGGGMPAAYAGDKTPAAASSPGSAPSPGSGSPASSSSSSAGGCDDIAPTTYWSCADQKKWGACDQWWLKGGGTGANGQVSRQRRAGGKRGWKKGGPRPPKTRAHKNTRHLPPLPSQPAPKGYCRQTCGACSGGSAPAPSNSGRRLAGAA
jgi:hypothetical protein